MNIINAIAIVIDGTQLTAMNRARHTFATVVVCRIVEKTAQSF
jgi:hypothetical protein